MAAISKNLSCRKVFPIFQPCSWSGKIFLCANKIFKAAPKIISQALKADNCRKYSAGGRLTLKAYTISLHKINLIWQKMHQLNTKELQTDGTKFSSILYLFKTSYSRSSNLTNMGKLEYGLKSNFDVSNLLISVDTLLPLVLSCA